MIHNAFREFQGTSYGVLGENDCPGNTLIDRGLACTFDDPGSLTVKVKVYSDVIEEAGAYIRIMGFDNLKNWVRTEISPGVYEDGERVPLSTTFQISQNYFSSITAVEKPITRGNVRLYEYDVPSGANVKALAVYEPDETLPQYRRYLIPGLSDSTVQNNDCDNDCNQHQVDVLVKYDFIPVRLDTDFLIIGNLPALKLAVMSILKEEQNDLIAAERLMEGRLTNE